MRKILVTGGAGFIGSNFIRYWLKKYPKDKIINLDKLTYAGHLSSTKDFSDNRNYKFIKASITNKKLVNKIMKGVDLVVHFAAESHVDRSIANADDFLRTNVFGTYVLLEAALQNKVKHFHHVSTDEVFGTLRRSKDKFNAGSCYAPRNPYSASKASSDHFVRVYFETYNLPITITNCSNNFGPYQDTEKFIPRMITNLLKGEKIKIYGDGKQVRDWLYVADHVRAIDRVINKGKAGETYLVGGMVDDVSNLEVARMILEYLELSAERIERVDDRAGHDRRYSVDWSRIKKELGWEPEYDFEKYLQMTVDWYKENEWWWRRIKESSEKFYSKN